MSMPGDETTFEATDMDGNTFWVDFDGAEGIGFWIGDPDEKSARLSMETTAALIEWFKPWVERQIGGRLTARQGM